VKTYFNGEWYSNTLYIENTNNSVSFYTPTGFISLLDVYGLRGFAFIQ
jgi:hypothetical protein